MLVKINFSSYDELFILGDIVDKGKENLCLLDFIWKSENYHHIYLPVHIKDNSRTDS